MTLSITTLSIIGLDAALSKSSTLRDVVLNVVFSILMLLCWVSWCLVSYRWYNCAEYHLLIIVMLMNGWFRYYCQIASSYSFHFYDYHSKLFLFLSKGVERWAQPGRLVVDKTEVGFNEHLKPGLRGTKKVWPKSYLWQLGAVCFHRQ